MRRIYIIFPLLIMLSACSTNLTSFTEKFTSQNVKMPSQCEGWEKIDLKTKTRYYLLQNDQRALVNIDSHNLRGKNIACWK